MTTYEVTIRVSGLKHTGKKVGGFMVEMEYTDERFVGTYVVEAKHRPAAEQQARRLAWADAEKQGIRGSAGTVKCIEVQ